VSRTHVQWFRAVARTKLVSKPKSKAAMPKQQPVIAIVDDDESVREATMSLLRASGFSTEAYGCAEDFLKSRRLQRISCLIADVRMPEITGPELHRRLVASGNPIPTVLITAHPDEGVRTRALKDGIVCYLTKPFDDDDLLGCIRSALEHGKRDGRGS
jgi:FixJ family two-component response regulator